MNISLRLAALLLCVACLDAAPRDRITRPVDPQQTAVLTGNVHRLAQPLFDQGPVDPAMQMSYMVLFFKPSAEQQAEMDQLLLDQQNPSSPRFRKWLTPEEFGERFGLSYNYESKVAAWLNSSGFKIDHLSRAKNWVAFSGSAGQVSAALHVPIHRFRVNGETHFANSPEPGVPGAFRDCRARFFGTRQLPLDIVRRPRHARPERGNGAL